MLIINVFGLRVYKIIPQDQRCKKYITKPLMIDNAIEDDLCYNKCNGFIDND